jgi:hypothetical protein
LVSWNGNSRGASICNPSRLTGCEIRIEFGLPLLLDPFGRLTLALDKTTPYP